MDDWTDVSDAAKGSAQPAGRQLSPLEYLASHISREDAKKVIDLAGVETMEDLALLADKNTFADTVKGAGLKIIPAKKLANAIQALVNPQHKDAHSEEDTKVLPVTDLTKQEEPMSNSKTSSSNGTKLDECIVVAIDRSGSMGSGLDEAKAFGLNAEKTLVQRSRMDAVKQCFYAFRDRTESLGSDAHHKLGLLQFDGQIDELLPVTSNLDQFEALVDDMKQRGSTAIYSAISHACRMLKPFHNLDPETDLRILVLTDGQNNHGIPPRQALREALEIGAVVDAIVVGDQPDANLRKIVTASGGTCFQICSLSDGFELMEAEAVVSLRSRRGDAAKPPKPDVMAALANFDEIHVQRLTQASQAVRVSTTPANTKATNLPIKLVPCSSVTGNPGDPGYKGTMGRIVKELKEYSSKPLDGIHIYANENDVRNSDGRVLFLVLFRLFHSNMCDVFLQNNVRSCFNGSSFWKVQKKLPLKEGCLSWTSRFPPIIPSSLHALLSVHRFSIATLVAMAPFVWIY